MRAAITGASGLLGGNLAIELASRGHHVVATKRGASRVEHLAHVPIEWVNGDIADAASLQSAFRGADAVFHCAAQVSVRRSVTPALHAANVTGTRNALDAAKAARVGRFVHCSTVGAVGLSEDGEPCTEEARWNFPEFDMADGYVTTKHLAEEMALREAQSFDVVVVNPTYMLGPFDAKPSSGRMIIDVARRKVPGYPPGFNNFVDVRDVAHGLVLALERGKRGERYILGGENLAYRDVFTRIALAAGVGPPWFALPRPIARLFALLGDVQERWFDREPLLNSGAVAWGFCMTFQFSSKKAERELGYTHRPIDEGIAAAIAYFRRTGVLPMTGPT